MLFLKCFNKDIFDTLELGTILSLGERISLPGLDIGCKAEKLLQMNVQEN